MLIDVLIYTQHASVLHRLLLIFYTEIDRYFLLNEKAEKMKEQLGVVRTNCIDCLDRTNVTQVVIR